ncbi:Beta-lactamase/transpeptidase-like protein [Pseudocohnilembus persalinus]|uniref:Beta-lactamase/transpeptidase-like protein n=1 Tax=Pseudocohnilembus persalinus TaxID=266149 RepID=A0A0V0QI74_PSEPJ|nr:Beta-lactamase/transpeptidase-like protein [Pseudocohnilembus persalinus]|eukprot:KRX01851.1 Beta-lactamase/transpeptidase-like protein [Pseudocohnilembus persalinus]
MDITQDPDIITAESWSLFNMDNGQFIDGKNEKKVLQVASLTKIMNLYTALFLVDILILNREYNEQQNNENKYDILRRIYFYCSQNTKRGGTTAKLQEGMFVSILDLFYGLMLPSGNDAAYVLAENFETNSHQKLLSDKYLMKEELQISLIEQKEPVKIYLEQMNTKAKQLQMKSTFYANTNGLGNKENVSSTYDVGILSCIAMKNTLFQKVLPLQLGHA